MELNDESRYDGELETCKDCDAKHPYNCEIADICERNPLDAFSPLEGNGA